MPSRRNIMKSRWSPSYVSPASLRQQEKAALTPAQTAAKKRAASEAAETFEFNMATGNEAWKEESATASMKAMKAMKPMKARDQEWKKKWVKDGKQFALMPTGKKFAQEMKAMTAMKAMKAEAAAEAAPFKGAAMKATKAKAAAPMT